MFQFSVEETFLSADILLFTQKILCSFKPICILFGVETLCEFVLSRCVVGVNKDVRHRAGLYQIAAD